MRPGVRHELESFRTLRPDWKAEGLLQVALLAETRLPPFRASAQDVDFRDHDANTSALAVAWGVLLTIVFAAYAHGRWWR
ncbi:MAG: hypothetical protein V3T72_11765 [Thermoanaerobaculia bacterium]